jgi:hypothetical protein
MPRAGCEVVDPAARPDPVCASSVGDPYWLLNDTVRWQVRGVVRFVQPPVSALVDDRRDIQRLYASLPQSSGPKRRASVSADVAVDLKPNIWRRRLALRRIR